MGLWYLVLVGRVVDVQRLNDNQDFLDWPHRDLVSKLQRLIDNQDLLDWPDRELVADNLVHLDTDSQEAEAILQYNFRVL